MQPDINHRSISGLKFSLPMAALTVTPSPTGQDLLGALCRVLAQARINLTFIGASTAYSEPLGVCCVDRRDQEAVVAAVAHDAPLRQAIFFLPEAGLIYFYPHHSSLSMLGRALDALTQKKIDIHALSSSISSICFVVPYAGLQEAVTVLSHCFHLPASCAQIASD